jgi:hypothetical protein
MSQEFLDPLTRLAPGEKPERLAAMAAELSALKGWLASFMNGLKGEDAQQEALACVFASALAALKNGQAGPEPTRLTPEELEWARSQIDLEEIRAGVEEIERTGGLELRDFIHEIEAAAGVPA